MNWRHLEEKLWKKSKCKFWREDINKSLYWYRLGWKNSDSKWRNGEVLWEQKRCEKYLFEAVKINNLFFFEKSFSKVCMIYELREICLRRLSSFSCLSLSEKLFLYCFFFFSIFSLFIYPSLILYIYLSLLIFFCPFFSFLVNSVPKNWLYFELLNKISQTTHKYFFFSTNPRPSSDQQEQIIIPP